MAPIARGTNDPQILMVNCKTSPYKTPEAFVAGMKKGDKISFGGTHTGTIDHITVFLWAKKWVNQCLNISLSKVVGS